MTVEPTRKNHEDDAVRHSLHTIALVFRWRKRRGDISQQTYSEVINALHLIEKATGITISVTDG